MEMKLYRDKEIRRSRNFVESGFMESVVARCFDLKDAGNLRQLIGDQKDCDGTNYKSCQKKNGLLCALFMASFGGDCNMTWGPKVQLQDCTAWLLTEVLRLEGNEGVLPDVVNK